MGKGGFRTEPLPLSAPPQASPGAELSSHCGFIEAAYPERFAPYTNRRVSLSRSHALRARLVCTGFACTYIWSNSDPELPPYLSWVPLAYVRGIQVQLPGGRG
eukprot:COSAG05_NODE_1104_length_5872_cov_4.990473_10_plen_102_part_01